MPDGSARSGAKLDKTGLLNAHRRLHGWTGGAATMSGRPTTGNTCGNGARSGARNHLAWGLRNDMEWVLSNSGGYGYEEE